MSDPVTDRERYLAASALILDGRDPVANRGEVMVTLEGVVATILILVMDRNHKNAAAMLNEGLVPGVERRIALGASRANGGAA